MSVVFLSGSAAAGISRALAQDVSDVETAERMAWVVLLMKECEDKPEWFPRGKWATVRYIENRLQEAVKAWMLDRAAVNKEQS